MKQDYQKWLSTRLVPDLLIRTNNLIFTLSLLAIVLWSIAACGSGAQKKAVNFVSGKEALWIQHDRPLPAEDSLFYLDRPAPLFRKEFKTHAAITSATLIVTAAGYFKASINGAPIEHNVLDPAWTDFGKRIYYSEFEVTPLINRGDNCLGIQLGNGFYNPLPLRKWGHRNLREDLAVVGEPVFITKLLITYENGQSEEIISDTSWTYAYGPIVKNCVYLGVTYDARREMKGWDTPGFDDGSWLPAKVGTPPGGKLQKAFFPAVEITQEITPEKIYSPEPGIWIVDMGVNFTGTYRAKLTGNPGDTITFRFGERIYENGALNPMTSVTGQIKRKGVGGPGAPPIAWQTDSYILGENPVAWFQPEFTYHTYRYMEIAGLSAMPQIADIKGLFFHSDVANPNHFSCSSDLLNAIQYATERTFLSNLVAVQSDCPAREKFGYGGDLNATVESFMYNFDMQAFYRKTIYDWVDAINDSVFVDTAPFVGIQYCGISWESAFLISQYYLYLYYNDTDIIKELYALDKQWMEKVARIHPEGVIDQGLSDHESLEPVPVQLTGTCHYLQCARIMETFAAVVGDQENEKKYGQLADKLKKLVKAEFWDKPVKNEINRQTLFATLLYHEIVPNNELAAAKDSLLNAVQKGPAGHFNTGIFGTKYVLETLSEHVSAEAVFEIVNSAEFPGWGFMIDQGATSIWETWKESDDTYSNCHPMFGTVTEWYYRWLGGIRLDPKHPGFKEFVLAPSTPVGLESVNCTYQSPYGQIVSNWRRETSGSYQYEMTIPPGSAARVTVPLPPSPKIEIKRKQATYEVYEIQGQETGQFTLNEGVYLVTVSSVKSGYHHRFDH